MFLLEFELCASLLNLSSFPIIVIIVLWVTVQLQEERCYQYYSILFPLCFPCVGVVCSRHRTPVKAREQLVRVSLLPSRGLQGSNSGSLPVNKGLHLLSHLTNPGADILTMSYFFKKKSTKLKKDHFTQNLSMGSIHKSNLAFHKTTTFTIRNNLWISMWNLWKLSIIPDELLTVESAYDRIWLSLSASYTL